MQTKLKLDVSDEEIFQYGENVDNFLFDTCEKNNLHPMVVVAIVVARLSAMCKELSFEKELTHILDKSKETLTKEVKNRNIH